MGGGGGAVAAVAAVAAAVLVVLVVAVVCENSNERTSPHAEHAFSHSSCENILGRRLQRLFPPSSCHCEIYLYESPGKTKRGLLWR